MYTQTNTAKMVAPALALLVTAASFTPHASVSPDRTRLIFKESDKSISVTLRYNDPMLFFLVFFWIAVVLGN